jgi:Tfp pilus assembly protein PilP
MKLTTGIVVLAIAAGSAWAQNPAIIQNTKAALQGAQQQQAASGNSTSHAKPSGAVPAKPSAAAAQTAKPAVISIQPVSMPAKPAAVPAKTAATPAKPTVVPAKTGAAPAKPAVATAAPAVVPVKAANSTLKPVVKAEPVKTATAPAKKQVAAAPKVAAKPDTKVAAAPARANKEVSSTSSDKDKNDKQEDKKYSMTGKRDPFVSPVVNRAGGSGCSTGKKCLDIEQIALHGVVKSDSGMIAVVTNSLSKAYFLRENDPVFNGYVVKITVDSIVFKQTLQDRLGKPFTKDVVKRILTPAV